jgi:uncharacterized protein Usg
LNCLIFLLLSVGVAAAARILFAGNTNLPLAFPCHDPILECAMVSKDFLIRLEGYGLTTADIHYHMPDHPKLLQQFVWQDYDLAPLFPGLKKFLDFWQRELDGALHSVRVAHERLVKPSEWKRVDGIFRLH